MFSRRMLKYDCVATRKIDCVVYISQYNLYKPPDAIESIHNDLIDEWVRWTPTAKQANTKLKRTLVPSQD